MRKLIIIALAVIGLATLTNAQEVIERKLSHFDKIRVTNEIVVYLERGESESARIEASGIDPNNIITDVTGKTLEITLKRGVYKGAHIEIYITYKDIRDIFVTGSGRVSVQDTIKGDKLTLAANTNGQIDAVVEIATIDVSARKGSTISLKGSTVTYEAVIISGATLSALDLRSDTTYLRVASRGLAKVYTTSMLDAQLRTGGSLTYSGNPKLKTIKPGIGTTVIEQD